MAHELHAAALTPRATDLTDGLISSAHELGLEVIPWTVDRKSEMAALIDRGVDGLISDYPDRVRQVVAAKGLPEPQALHPQATKRKRGLSTPCGA